MSKKVRIHVEGGGAKFGVLHMSLDAAKRKIAAEGYSIRQEKLSPTQYVFHVSKKRVGSSRSNPADSALVGARILGVTRTASGRVKALKLQLRPGMKAAGAGASGARRNPTSGAAWAAGEVERYGPNRDVSIVKEHGVFVIRRSPHHPAGHAMEAARRVADARRIAKRLAREKGSRSNPVKTYRTLAAAQRAHDKLIAAGRYEAAVVYDASTRLYKVMWKG